MGRTMFYFRYRILNTLRDELLLTKASAKMTLFMLLSAGIPTCGLFFGIGYGVQTHSVLRGIAAASIGLTLGACLGWMLPRAVWNILRFFGRRGWFLQPNPITPTIILSFDEFRRRSEALDRDDSRDQVWLLPAFITWAIGGLGVLNYLGRDSALAGIAAFVVMAIFVTLLVWIVLAHRRRVKLHGLACPNCDRELSDTAGGGIVVSLGLCRQCGVKVVDVSEELPSELNMQ
ncbi:MAG TPA: hypothetical protein VGI40_16325 [Pirellulaceae bacterium]|jgi:hypothetical protein